MRPGRMFVIKKSVRTPSNSEVLMWLSLGNGLFMYVTFDGVVSLYRPGSLVENHLESGDTSWEEL